MKRELTCINCPLGCRLVVTLDENGKEVLEIQGNTCPRGAVYAKAECTNPVRMVTAVIPRGPNQMPLAVRTAKPIPKDKIFDCLREIYACKPSPATKPGDIVLGDVQHTGVPVIATRGL